MQFLTRRLQALVPSMPAEVIVPATRRTGRAVPSSRFVRPLAAVLVGAMPIAIPGVIVQQGVADVTTHAAGKAFDAAPFGFPLEPDEQTACGLRWAAPRKIRRVEVRFPAGAKIAKPAVAGAKLEYWHGTWDGRPDRILAEAGAGGVGWARMDDWTNGQWKEADANGVLEGDRWVFTFNPTGAREFEGLGHPGVGYRKTLKIRVVTPEPVPGPLRVSALTDAVCQPVKARILLGKPAEDRVAIAGDEEIRLDIFNGAITGARAIGSVQTGPGRPASFTLAAGADGAIEADLLMAVDPVDQQYDRTIVTVRSKHRPFSFAADEIARGDRILIDDLGVLIVRSDDDITLGGCRLARSEFPGRTVRARVFDEPEQTLARAWQDMPLKHPLYFVHGLPGDRNTMRQDPNGDIVITADRKWFATPASPKDTARKGWPGGELKIGFGLPGGPLDARRELKDGYLPLLRTWWQDGPIHYEQWTVLDKLDGDLATVALDDPTVLLARIRAVNVSDTQAGQARLRLASWPAGGRDKLELDGQRVIATTWPRDREGKLPPDGTPGEEQLRFLLTGADKGIVTAEGDTLVWALTLAPGERHELQVAIPSITLSADAEIAALARHDFDADAARLCDYWRRITDRGAQITTPEPWLNDFYRAHVRHLLVNCFKETDSDRLHAHVGTFCYGVFPDESAMMISDLDRRGYHDEARRCLDSFLHYQGTVQMPGNFRTTEGLFYGSGGHDTGGYNKSHGWVMWNMAEHWRNTRDRAWMERAAPGLVKSCEWVIRERQATMVENPDGTRPIEYGWLPTGSLEDVTDYWYWMVTNACTVWGFEALADALADFGHPQAERLRKEARAYRDDFLSAIEEARIRAPVVRLRDGTYVPKYPSRLYERGRCHGWLRETLEGSIHLLITGLVAPDAPQAGWILDDFEDNLYISDDYGYAIPNFDRFWFSRGGFSMQANLLHGPLPYLYRDDIKHYLRAYFNGFASAFYPEIRMCNEHSLPELGYPAGDHFKSSDEAQSTYWLRLIFVRESGEDLYLGQAVPRDWLADGETIGIERSASYFGPLSLQITSRAATGEIAATLTPPERNRPRTIYVRLRHPDARPIRSVTLNGKDWERFDVEKEWIELPGSVQGPQQVVARY